MAKRNEEAQTGAVSMVPEHPAEKHELRPVEELAAAKVPAWEQAALMRAAGWAPGKQVSPQVFEDRLAALRKRPMGGGRLK